MDTPPILYWSRLTENAYEFEHINRFIPALLIRSAYYVSIKADSKALVKTDLQVKLPKGCSGRVITHSNLYNIDARALYPNYNENFSVWVFNYTDHPIVVKRGDGIGELVCVRFQFPELKDVYNIQLKEVDSVEELQKNWLDNDLQNSDVIELDKNHSSIA